VVVIGVDVGADVVTGAAVAVTCWFTVGKMYTGVAVVALVVGLNVGKLYTGVGGVVGVVVIGVDVGADVVTGAEVAVTCWIIVGKM
jgi:hypothetical protein